MKPQSCLNVSIALQLTLIVGALTMLSACSGEHKVFSPIKKADAGNDAGNNNDASTDAGDGSTDTSDAIVATAVCQGPCDVANRCGDPPAQTAANICGRVQVCKDSNQGQIAVNFLKPEYKTSLVSCFKDTVGACPSASDCYAVAYDLAVPPISASDDPLSLDCVAKTNETPDECQSLGGVIDDYCNNVAALNTAGRAAAEACIAKPCEEIQACLKAIFPYFSVKNGDTYI